MGTWGSGNLDSDVALDALEDRSSALVKRVWDGLSGPEFKAERRAVIEETFERLRVVCAKYEEQRGGE